MSQQVNQLTNLTELESRLQELWNEMMQKQYGTIIIRYTYIYINQCPPVSHSVFKVEVSPFTYDFSYNVIILIIYISYNVNVVMFTLIL